MTNTSNANPAGWYPDPHQPGVQRWWDGNAWTEHTQTSAGGAPRPPHAFGKRSNLPWVIGVAAIVAVVAIADLVVLLGGDGKKSPEEFAEGACANFLPVAEEMADESETIIELASQAPSGETLDGISEGLESMADGYESLAESMEDEGVPDVGNGQEIVDVFTSTVRDAAEIFRLSAERISDISPQDPDAPQQLVEEFEEVRGELESIDGGPFGDTTGSAVLDDAFDANDTCQEVEELLE